MNCSGLRKALTVRHRCNVLIFQYYYCRYQRLTVTCIPPVILTSILSLERKLSSAKLQLSYRVCILEPTASISETQGLWKTRDKAQAMLGLMLSLNWPRGPEHWEIITATLNCGCVVLRANSMPKTSNNMLQKMGFYMAVSRNLPASFSAGFLLASFQTPSFVQLLQFPSFLIPFLQGTPARRNKKEAICSVLCVISSDD